MIYADEIINYERSDAELEELILFLVFVVSKPARRTAFLLEKFLAGNLDHPFELIRNLIKNNELNARLHLLKVGQYSRINKSLTELVTKHTGASLRKVTISELEQIHGIGMKSSRCFISWSQKSARFAMLDTHILSYLRDELGINTPKGTPAKKKYLELEEIFLQHANQKNLNPTDLDLQIWRSRRV